MCPDNQLTREFRKIKEILIHSYKFVTSSIQHQMKTHHKVLPFNISKLQPSLFRAIHIYGDDELDMANPSIPKSENNFLYPNHCRTKFKFIAGFLVGISLK